MEDKIRIAIAIVVVALVGLTFWVLQSSTKSKVNNFQECVNAGYPVMESHPRQCKTPDGRTFVEDVEPNLPEEPNKEQAEDWTENNAPTYLYDGQDLQFVESRALDSVGCEDCYEYEFKFTSRHAGYGNREGEMVAQVLTDHTIVVTVKDGEITKVVTDDKFNEMSGEFLAQNQEDNFVFECPSGSNIQITYNGNSDTATVIFQNSTYNLSRARSASGARYTNEDESVVFWEHQGKATMEIDGEKFGECKRKD